MKKGISWILGDVLFYLLLGLIFLTFLLIFTIRGCTENPIEERIGSNLTGVVEANTFLTAYLESEAEIPLRGELRNVTIADLILRSTDEACPSLSFNTIGVFVGDPDQKSSCAKDPSKTYMSETLYTRTEDTLGKIIGHDNWRLEISHPSFEHFRSGSTYRYNVTMPYSTINHFTCYIGSGAFSRKLYPIRSAAQVLPTAENKHVTVLLEYCVEGLE